MQGKIISSFTLTAYPPAWIATVTDICSRGYKIFRFQKQRESGGSKQQKCRLLDKLLFEYFVESSSIGCIIHDHDLIRWSLAINRNFPHPIESFNASSGWLFNFKNRHRIVSRKILKFVTKKQLQDENKILNDATLFVRRIKSIMFSYDQVNLKIIGLPNL